MGNRISTEDLYKITQSLADRAVSDVKKRREDERKREEAIKKNREERLAAAAKQNRIPNYKRGSLWDQYKAALASGEAKNASDFITKRDARNAAWNKVGAETLNDDMEALAKSISSTYGTQFDPSKYYSQETINGSSDQVKKMRDRLNALAEYYNTYGGSDDQKKAVGEQIKAYDSELKFLNDLGAHYGQYKNEADFNYRTDKRRDEDYIVNDYDAEAGKKNLAELKGYLDRINSSNDSLSTGQLISNARSGKKAYNRTAINEAKQQYGLDGMTDDEVLNWLTQEYQLESFALNNVDRMRTAAGYRNLANNEDFLQGVISGKAVENPTFEDYLNYENAATQKRAEAYNKRKASDPILTAEDTKGQDAPSIVNKLRFYEDLTNDKYGNKTDSTTVWSSDLGAAKRDALGYHYGLMTDDEKRVYYYLLGTQGKEAADKYLEDMDVTLDYRNTEEVKQFIRDLKNSKIFGNVSAAALANTFGGLGGAALGYLIADSNEGVNKTAADIAYSAASVPLNVLGGGISTAGEIGQRLDLASKGDWEGKGYNPYENYNLFSVAGREARGLVAKDIEDSIGWEMFGQNVMSQVYQSLMSGVDSAFGMATLGKLYTISMGGSAAASKAAELYESGASSSQIYWESLLSGIAEATFEYLSIENLSSIKSIVESKPTTLKKAIKMILSQNGIEASEEVFTEIANMVIDKGIKKYDSDYDRKVTKYVRDGMTREEAVKKAAGEVAADIGWAGAGGFISGLASSSLTIAGAYRAGKANADAQISAIDPGNAEGLYNNAKKIDYSILNDASDALKKGDAKAAAEIISEGKDWYEYLKSYAKEKYGKNQASEISANIDASIDNLNQIKNLISSGNINADSIQAVLEKAKSAQDTKVDVTSANDEKLFSLLAKGEPSNSVIEKNILKDRGTLAAFERLTGLRIGGTTVSQKRADVREAFKAVSSSIETLKAAQNAIESGATATEGHKNAAVIIDQAIQANRAENSRLRNSEKVKSAETKAAIDATNRQHRFLETVRNYVINGGDLSGFTESPVADVAGDGGTNSSETKTTQETAKKRVRADFSAYRNEKYSAENASALANLNSKAEQDAFFRNENAGIEQEIKNIESSDSITTEEKAQRIGELKEAASRNNSLAKAMDDFREMGRLVRAGEVDKIVDSLRKPLKKMGVNIEVVDNVEAADGMKSGAYFDKSTNTIKVSRDWNGVENVVKLELAADGNGFVLNSGKSVSFDRAVTQTIAHEIAHADSGLTLDFIKAVAGTQYDAFDLKGRLEHPDDRSWRSEDAQKEKNWRRYVDAYTEQAMLEMKGTEEQRRASAEKVVNDAYIFEEIMADMFGAAVDDMGHSSKAGENIFWAMNRNKPGIIKRILNALERFVARIRGKDAYLAVEQRQAAERLRDMLTGELKRAYGTDVKGEAAVESGGGKRHSLAGQYSQTAKLNSLSGAVRMNENGTPMDTIRARTGWWLGKDGKWRYEIDDSALSFDRNGYTDNAMYLADYVRHDKLFAAYPWLRGVKLKVADVVAGNDNLNGLYNHHDDTIYLKDGRTDKQMKSTLLHELQHVIQEYEGFATGANPNAAAALLLNSAYNDLKRDLRFAKIKSPDEKMRIVKQYIERTTGNSFESQAQNYYYTNYGEQESRAVQERYAPTNDTGNDQIEVALYHNDGVIYDVSEEIDKAIDNLKEMGYNEKQVNSIIKRGIQNADLSGSGSESANSQNAWRRNNNGATEQSRGTGNEKRLGDGVRRRGDNQGTSETESSGRGVQRVLNEVSKPEKRFSLSSNVEQTKDLIAVHNMTAAELEKSLDLGGLPMPSIAIIKAADGHSEYGDVSLVFGKDTIDPKKSARNKVYGGDAWTPTFPKIDYKANEKVGKRIRDKYYDLSRKYGYDNTRALYNYAQDLSDVLTSEGGEKAMIDKLYGDTGMMQIYLMDTGRERVANVNKETKTALTDGQVRQYENLIDTLGRDEMNGFARKDGEELSDLVRRRKAFIEENEAGIRKAFEKTFIEDGMSAKDAAEVSTELALSDLRKYVLDTFNYIKNGAETVKTEFDSEATNAAIKKAADGEGYRKWINNLFGGAEEKSGIRNSKDAYTASGNRRSFEALHWENNLENIVKAMLERDETGGAFFSGTGIWGVSAKKYNSISEIKNDSSRLRTMNEAEYNALKEQYGARMQEIAQTLIDPKNDNYFIASDDAYSLIVDAVRSSKDESGILRYLKKYNSRATEKTASDIAALVRDIAEMPTGYFEAKPQRAVGFDEVKAVILPDNASGELVSRLESDGINTVTYKAGDENSRLEALNGVRDVRFSLSSADTDIYSRIFDMQREETKLTSRIREIEKSDAFKNANNDLSKAIDSDNIAEGMKAYQAWIKESGYADLVDRRDALRADLKEIRTKADNDAVSKAINEERTAIEESGLSEADYFRKQAVKEFGYTPYFYDAGYIMPNGKMLNFSGEKGQHYGSRGQDHRAIGTIYADTNGTDALVRFMNDGNIRIMAETPGLDISASTEPSKEQYTTIRRFANEFSDGGYFAVDLSDENGKTVGTLEYEGNINPTRIVNDIKHFYETGEVREQSGLDRFRYSLARANDEYMKAVESGNVEEQQRLVDEAAEKWSDGNEVYVTDNETGEAIFKFYRSADDGRTVWDGNGHNQNKGVFLTSNEYIADAFNYGRGDTSVKHITVYAKAENPFRIDAKNNLYTSIPVDESMPEWLQDRASYDTAWSDSENDYIIEQSIDIDNLYPEAFKHGYDAVIVENVKEGVGGGVAADVVLKDGGKQMKSADPITYDNDGNVIPLSERFNSKNNDIRYSLTRANNEYMKAVESGDTEEQRRLVDEAAKANGYDRLFWHGSKKGGGFTEFRDWSYFTENKKYASRYAKAGDKGSLYEVYANLGNAFDTRKPECREIFDKMRSEYGLSKVQESGLPDWTDGYDIAEFIDENGLDYDSIILDEGGDLVDGKPVSRGFSYVIRSSEQVKSADPITYDDSGNVIPLTERFDSGNRDIRWSISSIVGDSGKDYGTGVVLDSTLLDNLSPDERVDMVKEYVKELGGQSFTAFDKSGKAVSVRIAEAREKFRNQKGKKVPVNKHMTNYLWNQTKQEAIVLVDELITTAKQDSTEPAHHSHDWLDNNGLNDWDVWKTYIQDKEKNVWEASLQIANASNGDKVLYEVHPIKKVEGAKKISTTSTDNSVSHNIPVVNTQSMQDVEKDSSDERHSLVKSAQSETETIESEDKAIKNVLEKFSKERYYKSGYPYKFNEFLNRIADLSETSGERIPREQLLDTVKRLFRYAYENSLDGKALGRDYRHDTDILAAMVGDIENEIYDWVSPLRDEYNEARDAKKKLRMEKIFVPTEIRTSVAEAAGFETWSDFRKSLFGIVGLVNEQKGRALSEIYAELSEIYPEYFPDNITDGTEQAVLIADLARNMRVNGIGESNVLSYEEQLVKKSIGRAISELLYNGENTVSINAMRKRIAQLKEQREKAITSLKEKYAEQFKNRSEKQKQTVLRNKVLRKYTEASSMLDRPTTENHFTEAMRKPIMEFLAAVDITTGKSVAKQEVYDRILSVIKAANNATSEGGKNGLDIAETDLNVQEKQLIVDSGLLERMAAWVEANQGKKLTELSSAQLEELNGIFNQLKHLTAEIKRIYDPREGLAAKSWQAQKEIGLAQTKEREQVLGAKTEKAREKYEQIHLGALDAAGYYNTLGSDTMTAQFERFRQCQNRFSENIQMFTDRLGEIVDGAIPKDEHGKNAKEVTLKLSRGTLTATPAQLMSVYLMLNQEDSRRCLFNEAGGVVIGKFTAERPKDGKLHIEKKRTFAQSGSLVLNEADAAKITAALTDGQRKRADAISALLNNEAARLGNEVSMAMYGYKKYTTENYFPMRTIKDYEAIATDPNHEMNLLGLSFTKERTGRAGKALVAEDIYDVIGRHLTNMAQYNAFAQELDNAKKMYSLQLGDGTSLKQRIIRSYGREADAFYNKLINNLSGVQMYTNNSAEALSDKLLSNYKAAAVAGNVSVVLKQPMSIFRALPEFSLAGLKKSMAFEDILNLSPKQLKANTAEMLKYSGIARLKAWGSSENMTRKSFESLYNDNSDTARQKINEFLTSGAENADMWTWAKLWRMSKAEIDAQGKYTAGSKEYFEAVDRKFSDVIGKTQVVQSALDSSMAVQNAKGFGKFLFAFQNEPLKQYSYLISTLNDARRGKPGAKKKLAKVIASSLANTAAVSAISTFMAWLRGTLDRDDDDELLDDLMNEFAGNAKDDILSGAFAPVWQYIDTIMGAIRAGVYGNTVERLDMAALTDLGGLINKYFISQNGGRPNLGTVQDIVNVASNLFGLPAKNIFRDVKSVIDRIILELPVPSAAKYNYLKAWKDVELTNKAAVTEAYYDVLRDAVDRGRYSDYVKIKRDMIYHGYTETKIKNAVMKSSLMDDLYELKKVNPGSYKAKVNSIVSSVSAVSSLEGKEFEDFIESAMKRREREDGGSKTDDEVYNEMHRKMEKEVKEQLIYIDVSKRAAYIKKMLKTYGEYGITEADILKVLRKAGKA